MSQTSPRIAAQPLPLGAQIDDLDLHGLVGIRLVDASPRHLDAVRAQISPLTECAQVDPQIVIRFVDRIETSAPVHTVGLGEAEFSGDAYLIGLPGNRGRAWIPIDRVGAHCEILCERALPRVPLLRSIVNLTVLATGVAPAHASAVELAGRGIVTTGWSSGGKTGILLTLMALGGRFISDDVVYVAPDARLYGLHEPLSVKDYYLAETPTFHEQVDSRDKRRIRSVRWMEAAIRAAPSALKRRLTSARTRRRIAKLAATARTVHTRPEQLFGAEHCSPTGWLTTALVGESTDSAEVVLEPISAHELALRMAVSSRHEFEALDAHYEMFRYAFPERRNPHLEEAEAKIRDTLVRALEHKHAYRVGHPYPASIAALTQALAPLAEPGATPPELGP